MSILAPKTTGSVLKRFTAELDQVVTEQQTAEKAAEKVRLKAQAKVDKAASNVGVAQGEINAAKTAIENIKGLFGLKEEINLDIIEDAGSPDSVEQGDTQTP